MGKPRGKSAKPKASRKPASKAAAPAKLARASAKPAAAKPTSAPAKSTPVAHVTPARIALPPPPRDELPAPRDIARLTRYGERFGPSKIDVKLLPVQLPVSSKAIAVFDPGAPKSWRVFDRPVDAGQFRVMLAIARTDDNKERLAAVVLHVGRPPIAKWTVAHYRGQTKPRSADQLPRVPVTTGWTGLVDAGEGSPGILAVAAATGIQPIEVPLTDGRRALALPCGNGDYAAYWAVDAADKPICLVLDFDVFTQKEWKARPPVGG